MWPFPCAHVSMIGFMEKNSDDDGGGGGGGDDNDDDDNSDPVLHWSLYVLRDLLYDWCHILYSGNFLSVECNV